VKENINRKERNLEKTRELILRTAAEEFSEYGFSGARVDRISRNAGCNKAMIYYIFKNKHELHLAVLENLFEEKIREVESHFREEKTSLTDLFPMLAGYLKVFFNNPAYARIILYDIATGAETLRELKQRRPDLFSELDTIADMLDGLGRAGIIRRLDPDKSVTVIVLLVVGLANILPHMDLIASPGTRKFKELSNQDKWLAFLADVLAVILQPSKPDGCGEQ